MPQRRKGRFSSHSVLSMANGPTGKSNSERITLTCPSFRNGRSQFLRHSRSRRRQRRIPSKKLPDPGPLLQWFFINPPGQKSWPTMLRPSAPQGITQPAPPPPQKDRAKQPIVPPKVREPVEDPHPSPATNSLKL